LENAMKNPWLTKNPFLSAWLSAANAAAGTARGHATAAAHREIAAAQAEATRQVVDFWSGRWLSGPPIRRRTKGKR
jgi:hypothetical protein